MPDNPLRRALVLLLLGMGAFFMVAAVLLLVARFVSVAWQPTTGAIAAIAVLLAIPVAYMLWQQFRPS